MNHPHPALEVGRRDRPCRRLALLALVAAAVLGLVHLLRRAHAAAADAHLRDSLSALLVGLGSGLVWAGSCVPQAVGTGVLLFGAWLQWKTYRLREAAFLARGTPPGD